jgi:hypothetical protein
MTGSYIACEHLLFIYNWSHNLNKIMGITFAYGHLTSEDANFGPE